MKIAQQVATWGAEFLEFLVKMFYSVIERAVSLITANEDWLDIVPCGDRFWYFVVKCFMDLLKYLKYTLIMEIAQQFPVGGQIFVVFSENFV